MIKDKLGNIVKLRTKMGSELYPDADSFTVIEITNTTIHLSAERQMEQPIVLTQEQLLKSSWIVKEAHKKNCGFHKGG